MSFLLQVLIPGIVGQTQPPTIIMPPRERQFPLEVPVPSPAPSLPSALGDLPGDLPIAELPEGARLYPVATAEMRTDRLVKLLLTIDGSGHVTNCRDASAAPADRSGLACISAMALRFQTPPGGISGYLVLGVRLTDTSVDLVRAGEPRAATLDKTLPWISDADYPPAALRAGAEGRTVVAATVSPQGTAFRCAVLSTSGSIDLDDATCQVAMRARYIPARDWFGDPLASVVKLPVRWTIPRSVLPVAAPPPPAK